jgi:hypothetical protein
MLSGMAYPLLSWLRKNLDRAAAFHFFPISESIVSAFEKKQEFSGAIDGGAPTEHVQEIAPFSHIPLSPFRRTPGLLWTNSVFQTRPYVPWSHSVATYLRSRAVRHKPCHSPTSAHTGFVVSVRGFGVIYR